MDGAPVPMIGYWRVSLGREEMLSPELQQEAITGWAGRNGRRIVRWIGDPDDTGRDFDRRVQDAIAAVEAGEATEIGLYRYSRWGRNTLESLQNIKRVEDAGGDVVSVTEYVGGMASWFAKSVRRDLLSRAETESDQIGEAWKAAHANRIGRRLPASGTPRFGYIRLGRVPDPVRKHTFRPDVSDPAGERYVPDPVTGPVLAGLYERYAGGEGIRSLTRELNEAGVTTMRGGRWGHSALLQVLASGFGAGWLRVHDPACKCRRTTHQCRRVLYHPGAQEPVVGEETWGAFLVRMEQRRALPGRLHEPVYPLSGLLACGTCGSRLSSTYNYGQPGWGYRCPRRGEQGDCATGAFVRRTTAEDAVLAWLAGWARDIEAAAAVESARLRATERAQARGGTLAKQEAVLQRKLARLMERWAADEHMEEAAYELARAPLVADLEAVRGRMRDAQRARAANAGAYQPVMVGLIEGWPTFPPARQREMLSHLIARVEVYRTGPRKSARLIIVPVWEDA